MIDVWHCYVQYMNFMDTLVQENPQKVLYVINKIKDANITSFTKILQKQH